MTDPVRTLNFRPSEFTSFALRPLARSSKSGARRGHGAKPAGRRSGFVRMTGPGLRPRRQRDWTGAMFSR
jgi:hypothetical protein